MSQLTLVRHGQASYMAENYDKLSPLGEHQSRMLGEFWLQRGVRFDLVFRGPAERHRHTAAIVEEVYRSAGAPWPHEVTLPDLDEFDPVVLLRTLGPLLAESQERVRALNDGFQNGRQSPEVGVLLERLFQEVVRHWAAGTVLAPEVESWADYCARIAKGIQHIRSVAPKSSAIVAFTSGGPIAATVGSTLELTPQKAIDLVWVSRNSSYSEFFFSGDRFSLSTFNSHPHLDQASLLTYR